MDARYIGTHMKSAGDEDGLDGPCLTTTTTTTTTTARLFNSSYHQTEGHTVLNQKCLKRNYDEMVSVVPAAYGQAIINERCFTKSIPHHQPLQPQMLYRQPYSIPTGLSITGNDMQHLIQEPKFPPQTFEIPDIQDSNSVFSSNCNSISNNSIFVDPSFCNYSADRLSYFYDSAPVVSVADHSQCRTLVPSFPAWQSAAAAAAAAVAVSSTGSSNSSPVSHPDDSTSSAADVSSIQTPQAPPTTKISDYTSHSTVSRQPNKKARSPKRRKRKDPNEPQKPVSAYSLFFRNAQAAIKSQNPSATFGDVSKIVASMWDGLDDEVKNFYKRQMEVAKKEYLKQLAIYRATLVSKDVQGKTGTETESDLGVQPPQPPAPSSKAEEGSSLGLSPIAPPLGTYPTHNPMSPAVETINHMMSPPMNHHHHHHQTPPIYYSDGPPCLPGNYTSTDVAAMRNTFLSYSQKLNHESSVMSGMPEHGGYFLGSVSDSVYKHREYMSMENNFLNGPTRDIGGRSFAETDDGPKLT